MNERLQELLADASHLDTEPLPEEPWEIEEKMHQTEAAFRKEENSPDADIETLCALGEILSEITGEAPMEIMDDDYYGTLDYVRGTGEDGKDREPRWEVTDDYSAQDIPF